MKAVLPLTIIICMLLSGCGARGGVGANFRSLEQLRLVETLGYDAGPTLSAAAAKTEAEPALVLTAGGESLPAAVEALQAAVDRGELFFAHVRFVLLGREAAGAGVAPLLDFMERDVHMRLDTELLLLDVEAAEWMKAGAEDFDVTAAVDAAKREAEAQACGLVLDFRETALALSEYGAAPVMLLTVVPSDGGRPGLCPAGCGVLRGDRLAGTLERPEAEVLGLLLGRAGILTREAGGAALLCRGEGAPAVSKADPAAPVFSVELTISASVDQAEGSIDADALARELEARFTRDTAAMLAQMKSLDADLLGLSGPLRRAGAVTLTDGWLQNAEFQVEVQASVDCSFDLEEPVGITINN